MNPAEASPLDPIGGGGAYSAPTNPPAVNDSLRSYSLAALIYGASISYLAKGLAHHKTGSGVGAYNPT